jgi:methylated-DNA-protein-cysteine methyltransferase related protein
MTYGQIAGICGNARLARVVGGIAHHGPVDLPWHRVVNKSGGLASGYYGGREGHKQILQNEGIVVYGTDGSYFVNINELLWMPKS